jgi:hypothetical protein
MIQLDLVNFSAFLHIPFGMFRATKSHGINDTIRFSTLLGLLAHPFLHVLPYQISLYHDTIRFRTLLGNLAHPFRHLLGYQTLDKIDPPCMTNRFRVVPEDNPNQHTIHQNRYNIATTSTQN